MIVFIQLSTIIIERFQSRDQYNNLLYGWLREGARWSESCVLIGYPSGQDGPSCPLGIARVGPAKAKFCWRNVLAT